MPYTAALVPKTIHYCREALPQPMPSTFLCPRYTTRPGSQIVTSDLAAVTCKLCLRYTKRPPKQEGPCL